MLIEVAELKSDLGISSTETGDDSIVEEKIRAAQGWIERKCKRSFDSSTGTYYYRASDLVTLPEGSQWRPAGSNYGGPGRYSWDVWPSGGGGPYGPVVLWLGRDLLSVDGLTNGDGTAISSTGYWLEPRNDPPYQWVRLKHSESWSFDTDGEIEVAGRWGYSTEAPYEIVEAVKILAKYLYRNRDASLMEVVGQNETGVIQVPAGFPVTVKRILEDGGYVRAIRVV